MTEALIVLACLGQAVCVAWLAREVRDREKALERAREED